MEDVAKPTGLQKRKNGYYIRIAVPKDLRDTMGKNEIIRTLKTQAYNEACKRCRLEHLKIESMFDTERLKLKSAGFQNNTDQLSLYSEDQLRALAIEWIAERDEKHEEELAISHMADGEWEEVLQTLREDESYASLALKGDFSKGPNYGKKLATKILEAKGISFDQNSLAFKKLIRLFNEAILEVAQKTLLRHEGKIAPNAINPKFERPAIGISKKRHTKTLGQLVDEYKKEKKDNWSTTSARTHKTTFQVLEELIGKNTSLDKIDREECKKVRDFIFSLPSNLRQSYPAKKYTLREAHKKGNDAKKPTIAVKTANNYITTFSSLMKFAVQENYIDQNPATGLQKKEKVREKDKRNPFSINQLNQIFSAPIYTGCKDAKHGYNTSGNLIPDTTARYWAPILALWTGMRMHECLQLEHTDICKEDGVDVIHITTNSNSESDLAYEKRVKNESSIRYVPIHPELIKLGFLDFVEQQKQNKDTRLFPEIKAYKGDLSHSFSKWFNGRFLENTITGKIKHKTVFHSFRHNYRDALRRAKLPIDSVCALGGWSENLGVHAIYGGDHDAQSLYEDICKISYPNLNLSHLYKT